MATADARNVYEKAEFVLKFIAEFQKFECLWKTNRPDHETQIINEYVKLLNSCKLNQSYFDHLWKVHHQRNIEIFDHAALRNLQTLCERSGVPATRKFIMNLIKQLKRRFIQEILKDTLNIIQGNELIKSKWYYYEAMFFMVAHNAPREFECRDEIPIIDQDDSKEVELFEEGGDQIINDNDFTNDSVEYISNAASPTSESNEAVDSETTSDDSMDGSVQDNSAPPSPASVLSAFIATPPRISDIQECTNIANQLPDIATPSKTPDTQINGIRIASEQLPDIATPSKTSDTQINGIRIASEQLPNIATSSKISDTQNKGIRIACEQLLDVATASKMPYTQKKCERIVSEQLPDVATSNIISDTWNLFKKVASEELTNVAPSSRISETQKMHGKIESDQLPDAATLKKDKKILRQLLPDIASTSGLSFSTPKRKNIVSEPLSNVAATTKLSTNTQKRQKVDFEDGNTNNLFKIASNKLIQEMDEFDGIGNNVAAKLRAVEAPQRIMAEKLISDVLFHAQMNTLTPKTLLCQVPATAQLTPQLYQMVVLQ